MEFTKFQREWKEIAKRFQLDLCIPHHVQLDDQKLEFPVLLKDFGAIKGMLLLTNYNEIVDIKDRLVEHGYGYSCLSEPSDDDQIHEETVIEILKDWGWVGSGNPPNWYK